MNQLLETNLIFECIFRSIWNESSNSTKYREDLEELLGEYELVVEMAVDNGIDIVTQEYNINWDYIQVSF